MRAELQAHLPHRLEDGQRLDVTDRSPDLDDRHFRFACAARNERLGILIGVLSWVFAVIGAIPVTWALAAKTGEIFIKSSVGFFMSPTAALTWLGLVILLSAISSFYPARRTGRLAIREALAYE